LARLAVADRWLLGTLVPLFLACFALHVQEVRRSGLAQLPVWALADRAGGPPTVGGFRIETDSGDSGLRPGDRLLRVGDTDLRGAGHVEFDARVLAETGALGAARLVFERDGVRRETTIRPRPRPHAWTRPLILGLGALLCVAIVLRAPGRPDAQRFALAFLAYATLMSQFYGGPAWQTRLSLWLWNAGGPVVAFLLLRWAALFPAEVPADRRPWRGWPWLGAAGMLAVRASYAWGVPIPPPRVAPVSQALHGAFLLGTLAMLARNYRHAEPVGRRRLKWVLFGAVCSSLPLAGAQLALLAAPDWPHFEQAFALGTAATGLWVGFLVLAIVRANLFDVDRLLSATASLAVVAGTFALGAGWALPEAARGLAPRLAVDEGVLRVLLLASLLAGLALAHRRLRPWLDRALFPDRRLQELAVEQLLRDLPQCATREEVLGLVADRLDGILRPDVCFVYEPAGAHFTAASGEAPPLPARGPLLRALARRTAPLRLEGAGLARAVPDLADAERVALAAAGVRLLVPLRCGKDLAAFVALGARRSGDVYTHGDLTLLETVAAHASAALRHQRDAETIRAERLRGEELASLKAAADEALQRRSRFLAAASHDLRQPLHALAMHASLLRERVGDAEALPLVERIERASTSLAEMFSALLDLSRLDVGAVAPRRGPVALDPLFEDLAGEAGPAALARGLALSWTAGGLAVDSDPVLLGRILRNLLSNAIRYTTQGEVRLVAHADAARVWIAVSDTGPGIAAERHDEILREFVRLQPDAPERGLGLGLAIVDRLTRALGHALEIDSQPGRGSTFRVVAPRVEPPPPAAASPPAPLAGRLVALVDDDLAALAATREVLEGWGCRVVAVASAAEAIGALALRAARPDAILADFRLGGGGGDGVDAIAAIRDACRFEVPAAVLTGETSPSVLRRVRAAGFAHLAKPAAPARLRSLLADLVRA
jgi:signal transduction histidine kinase/CheY-like chemotaxis protein